MGLSLNNMAILWHLGNEHGGRDDTARLAGCNECKEETVIDLEEEDLLEEEMSSYEPVPMVDDLLSCHHLLSLIYQISLRKNTSMSLCTNSCLNQFGLVQTTTHQCTALNNIDLSATRCNSLASTCRRALHLFW